MRTAVRITDPYVINLIEQEQIDSREGTATKTAGRLIIERLALRNAQRQREGATPNVATDRLDGLPISQQRAI